MAENDVSFHDILDRINRIYVVSGTVADMAHMDGYKDTSDVGVLKNAVKKLIETLETVKDTSMEASEMLKKLKGDLEAEGRR